MKATCLEPTKYNLCALSYPLLSLEAAVMVEHTVSRHKYKNEVERSSNKNIQLDKCITRPCSPQSRLRCHCHAQVKTAENKRVQNAFIKRCLAGL